MGDARRVQVETIVIPYTFIILDTEGTRAQV
jgi:hypothetical protein